MNDRMPENAVHSLALKKPLSLTEQPASVYLSGLRPGSRRTMRHSLDAIARLLTDGSCTRLTLDWAALRYRHTAAVRSALMERYAPASVNKMLSALRGTLRQAFRLELIDAQNYARAVDVQNIKAIRGLRGRALNQSEIAALMEVCFNDVRSIGARDAALIALLRGSGLRRFEAVNLNLSDFNPGNGAIAVRNGKGGVDRTVYVPEGTVLVLQAWLDIRGGSAGPLLCHVKRGGTVVVRRLTPQAVLFLLKKRANDAGVAPFSPHDFRRTFVSDLLDAGIDMATVQKLAGHQDPATTSRYDRRGEEVKRRAVAVLNVPSAPKLRK